MVEREGHSVLAIGSDVGSALEGATIDTEQTAEGEQLAIYE